MDDVGPEPHVKEKVSLGESKLDDSMQDAAKPAEEQSIQQLVVPLQPMNSLEQSSTASIARTLKKRNLIEFNDNQIAHMELPYRVGCSV